MGELSLLLRRECTLIPWFKRSPHIMARLPSLRVEDSNFTSFSSVLILTETSDILEHWTQSLQPALSLSASVLSWSVARAKSGRERARECVLGNSWKFSSISLGDVTAHGRVQEWPSRKRLGTRQVCNYIWAHERHDCSEFPAVFWQLCISSVLS